MFGVSPTTLEHIQITDFSFTFNTGTKTQKHVAFSSRGASFVFAHSQKYMSTPLNVKLCSVLNRNNLSPGMTVTIFGATVSLNFTHIHW